MDDSGSTEAHGMTFSIDMNLERMQKKMGDKILIMDYKEVILTHPFCFNIENIFMTHVSFDSQRLKETKENIIRGSQWG